MEDIKMKYLYSILLFSILSTNVQAQERHTQEIRLGVSGVSSDQRITFTFNAIETVWVGDDITTSYNWAFETSVGNFSAAGSSYG
jgi:hypothetical protein